METKSPSRPSSRCKGAVVFFGNARSHSVDCRSLRTHSFHPGHIEVSSMGCPSAAPPEILPHTVSHMTCVDLRLSLDQLSIPNISFLQCDPEGEIVRYATQSREPGHYYRIGRVQNGRHSPRGINRPELMAQFLFHESVMGKENCT